MPRTIKSIGGGKRHPLNMRTTKETRERLEAAAVANGRSLAQEVEARLERSFEQDQRLEDVFGSRELYGLARTIAVVAETAASYAGDRDDRWLDDPYVYDQVVRAVNAVLEAMRPLGEIKLPRITLDDANRHLEEEITRRIGGNIGKNTAETMIMLAAAGHWKERTKERSNITEGLDWLIERLRSAQGDPWREELARVPGTSHDREDSE